MTQETRLAHDEEKKHESSFSLTNSVHIFGVAVQLWVVIVVVLLLGYLAFHSTQNSGDHHGSSARDVKLAGPDVVVAHSLGADTPAEVKRLFRRSY